jgi:hypothetical protein
MSKAKEQAVKIKDMADRLGWKINVRNGSILEITKQFQGNEGFVECDSQYYSILGLLPTTSPGSMWGTDGGGVGAISAMNSGVFRMQKSGGSKRVLSALQKLR